MSFWIYINLFPFAILWAMRWHIFVMNWCQNLCMDGKYIIYSEVNLPHQLLPLISFFYQKMYLGASLVAQWLRVCLPMQGTRIRALVWEDPTCRGAAGPVSRNYWACASGACAPQQERPRLWEARAPRWGVAPTCHNWRKPACSNEGPTQPINQSINRNAVELF